MKNKVIEAVKAMSDKRAIMIPDGGRGSWFKEDIIDAIENNTEMGIFFVKIFSRAIKLREEEK